MDREWARFRIGKDKTLPIGELEISDVILPAIEQVLLEGCIANAIAQKAPPYKETPMQIIRKNDKGRVVAGLVGKTFWNWLYIDSLWVDGEHRNRGLAKSLVEAAEKEAVCRGCHSSYLWTESFEGPSFYPKLGYKEFVTKTDFPIGFARVGFMKHIAA